MRFVLQTSDQNIVFVAVDRVPASQYEGDCAYHGQQLDVQSHQNDGLLLRAFQAARRQ